MKHTQGESDHIIGTRLPLNQNGRTFYLWKGRIVLYVILKAIYR